MCVCGRTDGQLQTLGSVSGEISTSSIRFRGLESSYSSPNIPKLENQKDLNVSKIFKNLKLEGPPLSTPVNPLGEAARSHKVRRRPAAEIELVEKIKKKKTEKLILFERNSSLIV